MLTFGASYIRDFTVIILLLISQEVTAVLSTLGDLEPHGPVLLAWTLLRQLNDPDDAALTSRLGNTALQLNVFRYLTTLLETEPFNGQTVRKTTLMTLKISSWCGQLLRFNG